LRSSSRRVGGRASADTPGRPPRRSPNADRPRSFRLRSRGGGDPERVWTNAAFRVMRRADRTGQRPNLDTRSESPSRPGLYSHCRSVPSGRYAARSGFSVRLVAVAVRVLARCTPVWETRAGSQSASCSRRLVRTCPITAVYRRTRSPSRINGADRAPTPSLNLRGERIWRRLAHRAGSDTANWWR
jgi:hypothetical protein